MASGKKKQGQKPIVLYDGRCRFCIASKQIADKHSKGSYRFVSTHSDEGRNFAEKHALDTDKSMYVFEEKSPVGKSDAAISILKNMSWWGRGLAMFIRFFPKRIRDWCYDIVAKHRR